MTRPDADEGAHADPSTIAGLRTLVEVQRDTIVAISIGSRMDLHRADYRRRCARLRAALRGRGLSDLFVWSATEFDVSQKWFEAAALKWASALAASFCMAAIRRAERAGLDVSSREVVCS